MDRRDALKTLAVTAVAPVLLSEAIAAPREPHWYYSFGDGADPHIGSRRFCETEGQVLTHDGWKMNWHISPTNEIII